MAKKKAAKKAKKVTVSKLVAPGTVAPVLTTPTADAAIAYLEQIMSKYDISQDTKLQAAKDSLVALCPELFAAGIFTVYAEYNGEGDSGDIDDIWAEDVDGKYMKWPDSVEELKKKLEVAMWAFIPGGFEINDGSFGKITLALSTRKLTREHSARVVSYEDSSDDFEF